MRYRDMRFATVSGTGIVLAALLAACGASVTPSAPATAPHPQNALQRALTAWAGFPIHASPRPLILLGGTDQSTLSGDFGFDDNGNAKLAFVDGMVDPPASFPSGPFAAAGFPIISARQAFSELTGEKRPGGAIPPAGTRVHTTSVRLGSVGFATDRGTVPLPAWVFRFAEATGSMAVLAITPGSVYPVPTPLKTAVGVRGPGEIRLGSDGRTLTVETEGAPQGTGPCDSRYSLQVAASETAVAIAVDVRMNPISSNVACPDIAVSVKLTTVLAAPLGGRVVVNPEAQPMEVTAAS